MTVAAPLPPGFWRVVWLLLGAARRRAVGRMARQRAILRQRAGQGAIDWSRFGFLVVAVVMLGLNIAASFLVIDAVRAGQRLDAEAQGSVVVDQWFIDAVADARNRTGGVAERDRAIDQIMALKYRIEARQLAQKYGGDVQAIAERLRRTVTSHQSDTLTPETAAVRGLASLPDTRTPAALLGSLALLWWGVMLLSQGEGPELDASRRRHPMWEWLFSHPVPPGAVFLAEMMAPIAANPVYYSAPILPAILYGAVYGVVPGIAALLLVGIPVTLAAAAVAKALEIGITLRLRPRSRGALLGLIGWLSYCSMFPLFLGFMFIDKIAGTVVGVFAPLAGLPWPWLGLFLGRAGDGSFSFPLGVAWCWTCAAIAIAGSVAFSVWATQRGLSGAFDGAETAPRATPVNTARFGRNPLYRKELLWFARDRSALVQAVLIPLTLAGLQLVNWRGVLTATTLSWNALCGLAVLFGTYFLSVLGPKSLASEGNALWLALTWPRGLESLLKAKARLWALLSSSVVGLVLGYALYLFPGSWWQIGLVAAAWLPFARSMAEKAVTLATVTAESGEVRRAPAGRRWAVQLGMLTFSIGIMTGQWALAVTGIVYSAMTAAAMWQNFRGRLPYLYDPWSETLPKPPTLMHAMIAISILVEATAIGAGLAALIGPQWVAAARAVSYGIVAGVVSLAVAIFLQGRGVSLAATWEWPRAERRAQATPRPWWALGIGERVSLFQSMIFAVALGSVLGLFGIAYLAALDQLPAAAELIDRGRAQLDAIPNMRVSLLAMSVVIAPFAEEYLFRGLVYRTLDREWGGWRAAVGSAAFFAIYHPFLAWLPVGLLGFANARLFKATGRLAPAVAAHLVYNLIVQL